MPTILRIGLTRLRMGKVIAWKIFVEKGAGVAQTPDWLLEFTEYRLLKQHWKGGGSEPRLSSTTLRKYFISNTIFLIPSLPLRFQNTKVTCFKKLFYKKTKKNEKTFLS